MQNHRSTRRRANLHTSLLVPGLYVAVFVIGLAPGCHGPRLHHAANHARADVPLKITSIEPAGRVDWPPGVERIEYTAADGVKDWALALPPKTDTTWVVHVHGHGSTGDQIFTRPDIRSEWLPLYQQAGLGVLSVNLRGNAWMAPAAVDDLHALLQFARSHFHATRFILASGSMGGTSNLIYAVRHPDDVAAVIALCPAADLASYHHWCREQDSVPIIREIAEAIESAYGGPPDQQSDRYHAHSAVMHARMLTMPVYVVHGSDDTIIPVTQSRALSQAMADRPGFRYVEVPGGDHEKPLRYMGEALAWVLQQIR